MKNSSIKILSLLSIFIIVGCGKNSEESKKMPFSCENLIYNEHDQFLVSVPSDTDEIFYFSLDGVNYSTDLPKAKDSGTYNIYFYTSEDYSNPIRDLISPGVLSSTISKRNITTDLFAEPEPLDSRANGDYIAFYLEGECDYGTFIYSLDKSSWTSELITQCDVGEYDLYWYIEGDKNHNDYGSKASPKTLKCEIKQGIILDYESMNSEKKKEYRVNNTYSGKSIYSDDISFDFEMSDLAVLDNSKYHKNLANLGLVLSMEFYEHTRVERKVNEEYLSTEFIKTLGVKNTKLIVPNVDSFIEDENDVCTVKLSHIEFKYNNQNYQTFFLVFKGTDQDEEWISNFDVGCNNSNYINESHKHTEWTNKRNHKGFDVAFNRIKNNIDDYISLHMQEQSETILFISGHSRGGAMANLAGAYYTKNPLFKVFDYTFASPNVTDDPEAINYECIFNLVNENDIVANIPPEKLGFTRYGKTLSVRVSDFEEEASDLLNREYVTADCSDFVNLLTDYFISRENIYLMSDNYEDPDAKKTYISEFYAYEGIERIKEELGSLLDSGNIILDEKPTLEDGKWTVRWRYNKAFIFDIIGEFLGEEFDLTMLGLILYIPTPLNELGETILPIMSGGESFANGHIPDSYIIVVNNAEL